MWTIHLCDMFEIQDAFDQCFSSSKINTTQNLLRCFLKLLQKKCFPHNLCAEKLKKIHRLFSKSCIILFDLIFADIVNTGQRQMA